MDNVTIKYFGEIIASASAWYTYECARLSEQPQNIDGDKRGRDDREVERFVENVSKGAKEQDMIKYADGSFRIRNKNTGLLEYRFLNLYNSIQSVYGYSQQECWAKRYHSQGKPERKRRKTFAEWAAVWYDTYKKPFNGEQSLSSIRLYIDVLNKYFGKTELMNISGVDCQRVINKYANKPNTQKKLYQVLRGILRKAQLQGLIEKSPAEDITLTPHIAEHYRALTYNEQNLIIGAADGVYRNVFVFCCCTGIRIGRVLELTQSNVKDVHIEVIKKQRKGLNQVYRVPILPELKAIFASGDKLFPVGAKALRKYFVDLYEKLGIEGATLHSFRHTFVSVLYDLGLDPKRIQLFAGHSDIQLTLNTYTHILSRGTSPIKEYLERLIKV